LSCSHELKRPTVEAWCCCTGCSGLRERPLAAQRSISRRGHSPPWPATQEGRRRNGPPKPKPGAWAAAARRLRWAGARGARLRKRLRRLAIAGEPRGGFSFFVSAVASPSPRSACAPCWSKVALSLACSLATARFTVPPQGIIGSWPGLPRCVGTAGTGHPSSWPPRVAGGSQSVAGLAKPRRLLRVQPPKERRRTVRNPLFPGCVPASGRLQRPAKMLRCIRSAEDRKSSGRTPPARLCPGGGCSARSPLAHRNSPCSRVCATQASSRAHTASFSLAARVRSPLFVLMLLVQCWVSRFATFRAQLSAVSRLVVYPFGSWFFIFVTLLILQLRLIVPVNSSADRRRPLTLIGNQHGFCRIF